MNYHLTLMVYGRNVGTVWLSDIESDSMDDLNRICVKL